MTPFQCAFVRPHLAAFVDGELGGAAGLRVIDHLSDCASCNAEVRALRAVGDALRAGAPADDDPMSVGGLASAVLARHRAERAESWSGLLVRAQEDWHWLMIGAGAVSATLVSTLALSVILAFGPRPERGDSLAAIISNSEEMAYAFPGYQNAMLMQVDDVGPWASRASVELASRVRGESRTEAELIDALLAVVTDHGRPVSFETMNAANRRHTEELLDDINRLRVNGQVPMRLSAGLRRVHIRAMTTVNARDSFSND